MRRAETPVAFRLESEFRSPETRLPAAPLLPAGSLGARPARIRQLGREQIPDGVLSNPGNVFPAANAAASTFGTMSTIPEQEQEIPMKCPLCNVDLVMSERQGIEIDYCPQCRGVWLDRGELDKIIERSAALSAPAAAAAPYRDERRSDNRRFDKHYDDDYFKKSRKKKKRGDFLSNLFEFGD